MKSHRQSSNPKVEPLVYEPLDMPPDEAAIPIAVLEAIMKQFRAGKIDPKLPIIA